MQLWCTWWPVFLLRKFHTEQIFVLVRMQWCNYVDTELVERLWLCKGHVIYIRYQIWNAASVRIWDFTAQMVWWYCAVAHLRTLEGTLVVASLFFQKFVPWLFTAKSFKTDEYLTKALGSNIWPKISACCLKNSSETWSYQKKTLIKFKFCVVNETSVFVVWASNLKYTKTKTCQPFQYEQIEILCKFSLELVATVLRHRLTVRGYASCKDANLQTNVHNFPPVQLQCPLAQASHCA